METLTKAQKKAIFYQQLILVLLTVFTVLVVGVIVWKGY